MKKLLFLLLAALFLTACSSGGNLTTDEVIEAFQGAGLQAEDPKEMTKDDYGMAPMAAEEGKIVKIGDDMNARILSFENEEDLDKMKAYYDDLGEASAIFFSWTIKHKNILVQLGGDLEEEKFNEYKEVLEGL